MLNKFGGEVVIEIIWRATGEVIDRYGPSPNMILDQGAGLLWRRITNPDNSSDYKFSNIIVGQDYGDPNLWSVQDPEPPSREMTEADQDNIYTTPSSNMFYDYPADNMIRVTGQINGQVLVEQNTINQLYAEFTSATLVTGNGMAFAYKRFPVRYATRDVDIRIIWTLTMQNAKTFCGFQTPAESGETSVYIAAGRELIKLDEKGKQLLRFEPHSQNISAVAADMSGYFYTGDEGGITQKNTNEINFEWQDAMRSSDYPDAYITGIYYDNRGRVYISATNGQVKALSENSARVWRYIDSDDPNVYVFGVDKDYFTYVYNPERDYIKLIDPSGVVYLFNQNKHTLPIIEAKVDSEKNVLTLDGQTVRLFEPGEEVPIYEVELPSQANCMALYEKKVVNESDGSVSYLRRIGIGYQNGVVEVFTYAMNSDWYKSIGFATTNIEFDGDGDVYSSHLNNNVYKIRKDGSRIDWKFEDLDIPVTDLTVDRTTT